MTDGPSNFPTDSSALSDPSLGKLQNSSVEPKHEMNGAETPAIHMNGVGEASGAVAEDSMTGLAVSKEPITDAAKAVESRADPSSSSTKPSSIESSDQQAAPIDINMEHTVSVDAPTSDLRGSPSPVQNPATAETKNETLAESMNSTDQEDVANVARPQTLGSPKIAQISPDAEHVKAGALPEVPASVPTPPRSSRAPSPQPAVSSETREEDIKGIDTVMSEGAVVEEPSSSTTSGKHHRAEEAIEPVAKRARTDVGSGSASPVVTFAEPDPQRKMTSNRQKYCLSVLRQLKRGKDAVPFLVPVDPVKLKIPDYLKIVTNPQDLGTIESKLKKNEFETIDDFIDSVQLVWANCERYNGQESAINKMALRLKEQFERQIRSMPAPEVDDKQSPAGRGSKAKKTNNKAPSQGTKPLKSTSPAAPGGVPVIRRESVGYDGRPKREIHAPPPKSLPYQNAAPRRNKTALQLKFCASVLKELTKKSHEAYAYPFYVPVDPVALGLSDYNTVIRNPMDLGTIKEKLSANEYESADDFEYDIRLMFRNCYKYNSAGSPVHAMGKRLESVFNEKWAEKPIPRPEGYGSDSEDDSGPDDPNKQTVQMLTKQLEAMKNQIAGLNQQSTKKKKKPKRDYYDDDGMGPRDSAKSIKLKSFGGNRKSHLDDIDETPMIPTFEQKTALSTKMGYMTEHQMPVVIQILKRTDPNFDPEDEEVELDVDKVHPKTIRLLWNWIMEDTLPSFLRKKQAKPKKNRSVLSENEQQRQIEQLEQQLSRFNGGADPYAYDSRHGTNIPNDDSSDDSDSSEEDD